MKNVYHANSQAAIEKYIFENIKSIVQTFTIAFTVFIGYQIS